MQSEVHALDRMVHAQQIVRLVCISAPLAFLRFRFWGSIHLLHVSVVMPVVVRLLPSYVRLYMKVTRLGGKHLLLSWRLRYWRRRKTEVLREGARGYRISVNALGLDPLQIGLINRRQQQSRQVVLADVDQDGFFLSYVGPIPRLPTVAVEQYWPRRRYRLSLVVQDGQLGVRKEFNGDRLAFLNELRVMHVLHHARCNVPSIMDIDFESLALTCSFILGTVLREALASQGALLRDRDVANNPQFLGLSAEEKWHKRVKEGRRVLDRVVSRRFLELLHDQLTKVHKARVFLNDVKYGNIVIEQRSGRPYLIDFDASRYLPRLSSSCFAVLRDVDARSFNLHFETHKPTRMWVETCLKKWAHKEVYAPVYIGAGLRLGNLWDADVGYGRWNFLLKGNLPTLNGLRILDLGANNGCIALQMLRCGAAQVIGIENNKHFIEQGTDMKECFEWADSTTYDFRYIDMSMAELPKVELGKFDLVVALCSMYYLEDECIENLIRHLSTLTNLFLVQCNVANNIGRNDSSTYRRASLDYNIRVLEKNGFHVADVMAPRFYSRPLIIARGEKLA